MGSADLDSYYGKPAIVSKCGCRQWRYREGDVEAEFFCGRHKALLTAEQSVRDAFWKRIGKEEE